MMPVDWLLRHKVVADRDRKRHLLVFLRDAGLLSANTRPVVQVPAADLNGADLRACLVRVRVGSGEAENRLSVGRGGGRWLFL